jgi:predicted ATP-grasp superfamily ATP-dependent carboligase
VAREGGLRILITEASAKHSVALQGGLRAAAREVVLVGHDADAGWLARFYGRLDRHLAHIPLAEALTREPFDLVIPVGGRSVREVAATCPHRAVLASAPSLAACYDKAQTMEVARSVGLAFPQTWTVRSESDLAACPIGFPCVLKPRFETDLKAVRYASDAAERLVAARVLLKMLGAGAEGGILVQEYVRGQGHGLFALFDRGRPVRVFMHERIREYPATGGASCAARAFYHEDLKAAGLRLLSALDWHGVAMVEFKRDELSGAFVLMEVNAKFWGSYELALSAGVNFGADLVRVFCGERLEYSEDYDRECRFYWPLDGDLLHLAKARQLPRVREYIRSGAHTNLFQSYRADAWKAARLLKNLVVG